MNLINSRNKTLFFVLLLLTSTVSLADQLQPFKSDGCSVFPDGTFQQKKLWLRCCTQHDFAYWKGGTYEDRLDADRKLKRCVDDVGESKIAALMMAGVRVGGTPYLPMTFRWGYGWSYPRLYGALSEKELMQVVAATPQATK